MSDMQEAAFSANWRMFKKGINFQFTTRAMELSEFIEQLEDTITSLEGSGYTGGEVATQFPAFNIAQQHVPPVGQQAAPPVGQQAAPPAPMGPVIGNGNGPLIDPATIEIHRVDGWVAGSYNDVKTKMITPCVWLYKEGLNFRTYTVYPEDSTILPFAYPTTIEWNGSPPQRQQAIASAKWHALTGVSIAVVPDTEKDGTVKKNSKGYTVFRPMTQLEMQSVGVAVGGPPQVANQPENTPLSSASIEWGIADHHEMADEYGIEDELREFYVDTRQKIAHIIQKGDTKLATAKQFMMLNEWAYARVKDDGYPKMVTISISEGVKHTVPLGSVVIGMLTEYFSLTGDDMPWDLLSYILQYTQEKKGNVVNELYDRNFDENLAACLVQVLNAIVTDENDDVNW